MSDKPKEFIVQTECGRNFIWSAFDLEHCLRTVVFAGFRAIHIEEYDEYQAEVYLMQKQEELHVELDKAAGGSAA